MIKDSHKVLDWRYTAIPDVNRHLKTVKFLAGVNQAVNRDIAYGRREEEGIQSTNRSYEIASMSR